MKKMVQLTLANFHLAKKPSVHFAGKQDLDILEKLFIIGLVISGHLPCREPRNTCLSVTAKVYPKTSIKTWDYSDFTWSP